MPRWRKAHLGKTGPTDVADAFLSAPGLTVPDLSDLDGLGIAILALLVVAVAAVVIVPLLLFGIELILLGLVIAAGIAGRTLLGRPWVVQAKPIASNAPALKWRVVGWRRSSRLIEEVTTALSTGLEPLPAEALNEAR